MNLNRPASELRLIEFIRKKFSRKRQEVMVGIGDDAMVFRNGIVVSTDSFVENTHFNFRYFSKFDLGYRVMAGSLSDLAAMAAEPVCALMALYLPARTTRQEIRDLYKGFEMVCRRFKVDISGGDIIESPFWGVTVTVIGKTKKPLLRSGAKPGDRLYLTNMLGLAEVGRIALQHRLDCRAFPHAVAKHLHPEPRIYESRMLGRHASSCIDTSDGLSTDAAHLCDESKVKIIIEAEKIRFHPEVKLLCRMKKIDPLRFVLSAGEDFELLFTAGRLPGDPGFSISRIGRVEKGRGLYLETDTGLRPLKPTGFEHLTSPRQ